MAYRTRSMALFVILTLALQISAQTLKPIPARVQQARDNGTGFPLIQLFEKTTASDAPAARFAQYAQFLQLNPDGLNKLLAARPVALSLTLPYNEENLTIDLVSVDILAADFAVTEAGSRSGVLTAQTGLHFRGNIRGEAQSVAAFSFFDGDVMGFVSDEQHGNLVLGKVQHPKSVHLYMLYSDAELAMDNPFECIVREPIEQLPAVRDRSAPTTALPALRVWLESDHQLLQNRGGVQQVVNYLVGIFNQTACLFANEQISLQLSHIAVWVSPDDFSGWNGAARLDQFRQRTGTNADLAQLIGLYEDNPESVAIMGAFCSKENAVASSGVCVSYSNVPTYSWATEVVAHEIGHNLGASHTQWCGWPGGPIDQCRMPEQVCSSANQSISSGNTVMSYCPTNISGINFNKGFGVQPGNLIRSTIQTAPCLTPAKKTPLPAQTRTRASDVALTEYLTLSPNPAGNQVNIQLRPDDQRGPVQVTVLDLTGRPALTQTLASGVFSLDVDLANVPKGIYLVQVRENGKLVTTKRLVRN